jgi:hypothetical protein
VVEIDLDVSSSKDLEFFSYTSSFSMSKACCTDVIIGDSEDSLVDKLLSIFNHLSHHSSVRGAINLYIFYEMEDLLNLTS